MIEIFAPQGCAAWKAARAGCITASNFHLIRADKRLKNGPNKGDYSEAAKNYVFRLAIERISGEPLDEGYETWAMERGHELEPLARAAHESLVKDMVREVGFVKTDDGLFGASADGDRQGGKIGAEYKCFVSPEKLRAILIDDDISMVRDQCLGGIWLTGADVWEFGLYCPALDPVGRAFTMRVVERDDDAIQLLEVDLIEFERLVSRYEAALRSGLKPQEAMVAGTAPPPASPRVYQPAPTPNGQPAWLPDDIFA